jgi:hypothetical protein
VNALPARVSNTAITQQANGQNRLFPATTRNQVSVYSSFGYAGQDGGQQ